MYGPLSRLDSQYSVTWSPKEHTVLCRVCAEQTHLEHTDTTYTYGEKYTAVNISHAHTRSSRLEDVSPNQSSKAFGGKSRDHTESSALFALLSHFSSPGQLPYYLSLGEVLFTLS